MKQKINQSTNQLVFTDLKYHFILLITIFKKQRYADMASEGQLCAYYSNTWTAAKGLLVWICQISTRINHL